MKFNPYSKLWLLFIGAAALVALFAAMRHLLSVGQPDLVPVAIKFVVSSNDFKQVLTVKNQGLGDVPLPGSLATVTLIAKDNKPSNCYGLKWTKQIKALKAKEPQDVEFNWLGTGLALSDIKACGGDWKVVVDSVTGESNKSNNTAFFNNQ